MQPRGEGVELVSGALQLRDKARAHRELRGGKGYRDAGAWRSRGSARLAALIETYTERGSFAREGAAAALVFIEGGGAARACIKALAIVLGLALK